MMERMCVFSTRTSLNSSWLPQKQFLTVAEAVDLQLLAYLEGKEDLHPKSNPSPSVTSVLLINENFFLLVRSHPIRHRGRKKKKKK